MLRCIPTIPFFHTQSFSPNQISFKFCRYSNDLNTRNILYNCGIQMVKSKKILDFWSGIQTTVQKPVDKNIQVGSDSILLCSVIYKFVYM